MPSCLTMACFQTKHSEAKKNNQSMIKTQMWVISTYWLPFLLNATLVNGKMWARKTCLSSLMNDKIWHTLDSANFDLSGWISLTFNFSRRFSNWGLLRNVSSRCFGKIESTTVFMSLLKLKICTCMKQLLFIKIK